jgi:ribosomal 50S subunit-recycling heat shock protein
VRLDKFLKTSRLIKRRVIAKALCDAGKVYVNSRVAKPGHEVKPGDIISIKTPSKATEVRVLEDWLYETLS